MSNSFKVCPTHFSMGGIAPLVNGLCRIANIWVQLT